MTTKAVKLIIYILVLLDINYLGKIIYKPSKNNLKKQIISSLILIIILILTTSNFDKLYIPLYFYFLCIIFYKITYKKNTYLAIYSTLIIITMISISKLIILLLFNIYHLDKILILSIFLTFLLRNKINHLTKLSLNITLLIYILLNLYLIYTILISDIDYVFIQNIITYLLLSLFIIIIILQEQKLEKLKIENNEYQKYSKTAEQVITSYRKASHEYKNKLIIIKSMINYKNKKLIKYINYLIDEPMLKENKWLNELRFIPFPEIKNFINYKMNILEKQHAKIELFIDTSIANINSNKVDMITINNINTIIGIILDNIIDSIKETKEKLVSINMYIDKDCINIIFANTFENTIDLTMINNLGYSTKGSKRGIGLSLVNDIIKSTKTFELETKIEEKFFIQHLKINNINKYMK